MMRYWGFSTTQHYKDGQAINEMLFMERRCFKSWSGASLAEHLLQQREKRK